MNEITQIHLGRTAFTIAVDARRQLEDYLQAVKKHMGDTDEAVDEVELRMAELLTERGITGSKVVLVKDVEYLKEQLGEPKDFDDDEAGADETRTEDKTSRRLFRDTENGMIAGVAAGLANYFRIDAVIVRILFVVATLAGGWGIPVYIVLWLIVPEAKTSSDTLQMQGKAVTVDTIKQVVERADVQGAATRFQRAMGAVVSSMVRAVGALVGLGLVAAGVAALLGATIAGVYWGLNHDLVPAGVFPVGAGEVALICLGLVAVAIAALFFIVAGLAVMRRRWPLPGWALGALVAVFLASLAVGSALAVDAAPRIQKRYEAAQHSYVRPVTAFDTLHVLGDSEVQVRYEQAESYSVVANYWGDVAFSGLKTSVSGSTLTVDARPLADSLWCHKFCLIQPQSIEVVVRAPSLQAVTAELRGSQLTLPGLHDQTLKVRAIESNVVLSNIVADNLQVKFDGTDGWTLTATGDYVDPTYPQQVSLYGQSANITARTVDLNFAGQCGVMAELTTGPSIEMGRFDSLAVNGEAVGTPSDLRAVYDKPGRSPIKCVNLQNYLIDSL